MFASVRSFMQRNMRLVSGVVLATRYGLGDVAAQYFEVSNQRRGNLAIGGSSDDEPVAWAEAAPSTTGTVAAPAAGAVVEGPQARAAAEEGKGGERDFLSPREFFRHQWDLTRTASFVAFGIAYFGFPGPGHYMYTHFLPRVFGPNRPLAAAMFDAGVVTWALYMPMYYVVRSVFSIDGGAARHADSSAPADLSAALSAAYETYKANAATDTLMALAVWVPFHFVNFKFFPIYMRTSVLAVQGIAWVAILSAVRGDNVRVESDPADAATAVSASE